MSTAAMAHQRSRTGGRAADLVLAHRVADPTPHRGPEVVRQLVQPRVGLGQQLQRAESVQSSAGPVGRHEVSRQRPERAGDSWSLGVDHPSGDGVEVAVARPGQAGEPGAHLVTQPDAQLGQPGGHLLPPGLGPFGRRLGVDHTDAHRWPDGSSGVPVSAKGRRLTSSATHAGSSIAAICPPPARSASPRACLQGRCRLGQVQELALGRSAETTVSYGAAALPWHRPQAARADRPRSSQRSPRTERAASLVAPAVTMRSA